MTNALAGVNPSPPCRLRAGTSRQHCRKVSVKIGFGNMAEPDSAPSPSGNVAEKFPPAGGMVDWESPQQAHLSYKRYACASESKPGMGVFHFIPTDNSSEIVISLDGIKADNQLLSF